ncbi:MAG: phosphotransferase [Burkholderiales bacterium]|nr:phosphotransferase [Burkholderiales bacterium]
MSRTALVAWHEAARRHGFERWLAAVAPRHGIEPESLEPASADASFRRYLRVQASKAPGGSLIVMDAPPPHEDVRPFVKVAGLAQAAGLNSPRVLESDEAQGFLLLTDLGRRSYLDALQGATAPEADRLMRAALAALVRWQAGVPADLLPRHDQALIESELALFPEWCVRREFGIEWNAAQQAAWKRITLLLAGSALAQPVVALHADFMPRNLMMCEPLPGIIDFQDAMAGALSYDLASLLRDAFLSWDEEQELDWGVRYWEAARRASLPVSADFGAFWQALEWMGLQRHLRVMGIFCRLKHRDGKAHYAGDLPRFFTYCTKVALRYAPLSPLLSLLEPMSGREVAAGFTF